MSNIPEQLQTLYKELDRLKASGEDVVADIRAEINNLELEYLNKEVFPKIAKSLGKQLEILRCEIDFSLQFDGSGKIDYSFCTSGSSIMMRDSMECCNSTSPIPSENSNSYEETPIYEEIIVAPLQSTASSSDSALITENTDSYDQAPVKEEIVVAPLQSTASSSDIISEELPTDVRVYIKQLSNNSIAVYGAPTIFIDEFKKRGGYFNTNLRKGVGWIFSKSREGEIRRLLLNNSITIIKGEPTIEIGSTIPSSSENSLTNTLSNNGIPVKRERKRFTNIAPAQIAYSVYRKQFINFLRNINNDLDSKALDILVKEHVGALESKILAEILSTVSCTREIFNIRDYIYIPRILKAVESNLTPSCMKDLIISGLKFYHRFVYFNINGRDVKMLK